MLDWPGQLPSVVASLDPPRPFSLALDFFEPVLGLVPLMGMEVVLVVSLVVIAEPPPDQLSTKIIFILRFFGNFD